MYYSVIQQFARTLRNLELVLEKARLHAETKKFDANNFCQSRLIADMLPFSAQIQIVTDVAKGAAAGLSGKVAPRFEDNETSFAELHSRVQKCVSYLESLNADDFSQVSASDTIKIGYPAGKGMYAEEFLLSRAIPNFFFHATMVYGLLRAAGVDIGKNEFLGDLKTFDL